MQYNVLSALSFVRHMFRYVLQICGTLYLHQIHCTILYTEFTIHFVLKHKAHPCHLQILIWVKYGELSVLIMNLHQIRSTTVSQI